MQRTTTTATAPAAVPTPEEQRRAEVAQYLADEALEVGMRHAAELAKVTNWIGQCDRPALAVLRPTLLAVLPRLREAARKGVRRG